MTFIHYWTFCLFALASLLATALPQDIQDLAKRGAVLSTQRASEPQANGRFLLENNLWGQSSAISGSQTSQVTATIGNSITWVTNYTWVGGIYKVKSFANLDLKAELGKQLSSISKIPTVWKWSYASASTNLSANVAYDMWLGNSSSATGSSSTTTFEVMVWVSSRGGATPYGSVVGSVVVNGVTWKLYKGNIKTWIIFSFLTPSENTNFNSDLKPFFAYLIANQGISSSQYLVQLQAGTEPFIGNASLKTSSYSVSVNSQSLSS